MRVRGRVRLRRESQKPDYSSGVKPSKMWTRISKVPGKVIHNFEKLSTGYPQVIHKRFTREINTKRKNRGVIHRTYYDVWFYS